MATATLTSKGQLTVPKKVREQLDLREGDRVDFVENKEGGITLQPINGSVMDLYGILPYEGPSVSLEDMDRAVLDRAAENDRQTLPDDS